jgi:hypothetical protein
MPLSYSERAAGEDVRCATPGARARRITRRRLLLADEVRTGKLTFSHCIRTTPMKRAAHHAVRTQLAGSAGGGLRLERCPIPARGGSARNTLHFFVGATEELFAHCSLNLFVKRRVSHPGGPPEAWRPSDPLEKLLAKQFELFQVTVSASGLPGISPRNGDAGKAGFLVRKGGKAHILVPYFTGNFIHGHAAKLWSNRQGALMVRDDHTALSQIVIRGKAYTAGHDWVRRHFPDVTESTAMRRKQSGEPAADPEYWFVQEVSEILQQDEPLAANALDPVRPANTIHAAGPAHYGKKAHYFETANLPPYDQVGQHEREHAGRPADPSGASHRHWREETAGALAARREHLGGIGSAQAMPESC